MVQALEGWKIGFRDFPDRIQWGYRPLGQFNVKEALGLARGSINLPTEKRWCRLWVQGHWPKITLFLWILMWGRILTWENLRKHRMIGSSVCVMCHMAEKTTGHLFEGFDWVRVVWEKGGVLFGKS